MDTLLPAKKHRKSKSGAKATKKDAQSKKKRGLSNKKDNPRAFGVANVGRTKREQQRNMDRSQKKEVVPLTDRSVDDAPPPVFVVVMGPSGVGKTTPRFSVASPPTPSARSMAIWVGHSIRPQRAPCRPTSTCRRACISPRQRLAD